MRIKLNNSKLNLSIDIMMFVIMSIIAGIGLMIKYVLVPGFKRNEIYGKDVELYFWGLDRHQWGTIHLIFGIILLFFLVLHIILHWKTIKCIYRKMISGRLIRVILALGFIVLSAVFCLGTLFIKPEVASGVPHYYHKNTKREKAGQDTLNFIIIEPGEMRSGKYQEDNRKKHQLNDIEIYGSMTLNEVSEKYNIPLPELAKSINVPVELAYEKLGRLRKRYGFHMDDLRKFIDNRKVENDR